MSGHRSRGTVAFGAVALASLVVGYSLDKAWPNLADRLPVTANIVAGFVLLPAEIFLIYAVVDRQLARRRERRWSAVAAELTEAVEEKWTDLRELLDDMRRVPQHLGIANDPNTLIDKAVQVWQELHAQDEAQPDGVRGTTEAHWVLPEECDQALSEVAGIWQHVYSIGLYTERAALQRRLSMVLLPRLSADDPDLISAARLMIDALSDIDDLLQSVAAVEDPFPESPFWSPDFSDVDDIGLETRPVIPVGAPDLALSMLRELRRILRSVERVVDRGDRLAELLVG